MMKSLGIRYSQLKIKDKKGFTLIEIVVVIAIMAILALILVPNLTAWVQKGDEAKIQANMKSVHTAAEMVRQTEGSLIEERIKTFSNNEDVIVSEGVIADEDLEADKYTVTNKGGQTVVKYKTQEGKVFTFSDVSNVNNGGSGESEDPNYGNEYLDDGSYTWITLEEMGFGEGDPVFGYFSTNEDHGGKGFYHYTGEAAEVVIPHIIHGHKMTSYSMMFAGTSVEKVVSNNPDITDMNSMFYYSQATTLDLSKFDTSQVTNMSGMFLESQAKTLDLRGFITSNVTDMSYMFDGSPATTLDLSSFNTSKVTDMSYMFASSQATTLNLSSFDTSKVTDMNYMFYDSQATTGYARTQADADKFNGSSSKPAGLTFIVKP